MIGSKTAPRHLEREIPRAAGVDYRSTDQVYAYSCLLARLLERHGGLNAPRKNSSIVRALDAEGRYWLTETKPLLTDGPLSAIPDLLEAYIFFDSVCRGCKDTAFYNGVRSNAVTRWLAGDRSLTETQVVCLLWPMVGSDPRHVDPRYARYCFSCLDSWIKELRASGRFNGIPDAEARQRLDFLLDQDLFAFQLKGES